MTAMSSFSHPHRSSKPLSSSAGPWISGGIEFNWPQHHRPATFLPVSFEVEANGDGSKTIWGRRDPNHALAADHLKDL
jgi:Domain of unknown function (DUF5107)